MMNELRPALPIGSLDAYIEAVHRIPMLTVEEERELAERYRRHEDLGDIDRGAHVARELFNPQGRFRRDLVLFTAALDDRVHAPLTPMQTGFPGGGLYGDRVSRTRDSLFQHGMSLDVGAVSNEV